MKLDWSYIVLITVLVLLAYRAGQMSESEGFQSMSFGAAIGIGIAVIIGGILLLLGVGALGSMAQRRY
jgi:hypothetical protein